MRKIIQLYSILFLLLFSTKLLAQTTRYVSSTGANTLASTATSWATSSNDLQAVINASSSGDKIFVKAGTYVPEYIANAVTGAKTVNNRDNAFVLKEGVALYGGFDGTETDITQRTTGNQTILSGDIGIANDNTDNAYHIVITVNNTNATIFDGFSVTQANADGSSIIVVDGKDIYRDYGGGMYNFNSSPTINNTTFSGNNANYGGGMFNFSSSSPTITNTTFSGNNANYGGGMYNNSSSSPVITNTSFSGNNADDGGGMYNFNSSPKIYNSIVWGAVYNYNSTPDIQYSLVQGNTDTSNGNLDATGLTEATIFTDPTNGDYSLKAGSVATNTGSNTLYTSAGGDVVNDVDLAGNMRVINTIDIGAYEYQTIIITPDVNNIIYVNKTATGNSYGDSWANAIPELADALVWANNNKANFTTTPLQIWVAGGTYKPLYSPEDGANFGTDQGRYNAFSMVNNVQLYGGFAGTETVITDRDISITTNQTILSGDFNGDDVITGAGSTLSFTNNTENAYHVLISSGNVGTALLNGFTITGGNANSSSSRTINGNNTEANNGGGMYNTSSSPTITNTSFSGNNAYSYGGGMFNSSSSPTITNTTFSGNNAEEFGGGMYNVDSSSPTITNTTFSGNNTNLGGGMLNNYSSPTITNTTFSGNNANLGGGMLNANSSNVKIYNSIVWGAVYNSNSTPDIQYSLVQGNTDTSNGNLDATGLTEATIFTDPTNGDYSLKAGSVATNAGSNTLYTSAGGDLTNDVDLAGNMRVINTIDMGAYEYQTVVITPDVNNIIYVNKTATGNSYGDSWANAIPELADALVWANNNKANFTTTSLQIWVAGGTYNPLYSPEDGANFGTDQGRDNAFLMVNNVQLYGGFAGTETVLTDRDISITTNQTILSGDFNGDDVITGAGSTLSFTNNTENAYNVLISSGDVGTAVLDGFTVTGGNANSSSSRTINGNNVYYRFGGGMYNTSSSSPVIANTTFSENNASGNGGGMYTSSSSPVITNTTFSGNNANSGGGMFNYASSPTINNTTFSGNNANSGGGMYNNNYSYPVITNTTFSENNASGNGGGMYNYTSSPVITNTTFSGNNADNGGGMFNYSSSSVITNTTFSGNNANSDGGGMLNANSSNVKIYNSIVWGEVYNYNSTPDIQYSLVQGNTDTSNGNLDATGLTEATIFTDPTNGDYSLKAGSVATNTGSNTLYTSAGGDVVNDVDLAGNTRVFQNTIDIGAYEYQTIVITPDVNNILYVSTTATGDDSGDSWANAIPELADALVWANNNKANFTTTPLQIWVAGGTYKPLYSPEDGANFGTDQGRDNAFLMVNNVQLYGGFAGTETVLTDRDINITTNQTILSGDFNGDDVITGAGSTLNFTNNTENAYHVLISSGDVGTALLNGFTITGGNANDNSTRTINGNSVYYHFGGGMYNSSSSPVITNTTFSGNNTDSGGGGMFNYASSPVITNTTFSGNSATSSGGGICNDSYSSPVITNTTFSGNYADNGGGMYNNYSSSPDITNTTFSGNNATSSGGGMYNFNFSSPKIYNSIVWGAVYNSNSTPDIQYSLVQGNTATSNGNLDATGLTEATIFTDPTNGDYSLKAGSVATNTGSNTLYTSAGGDVVNDVDLAGNTRVSQNTIDMGAYEYQTVVITPDVNNIIYVNKTATGNKTGDSWANAIPELADALVWANNNKANFTSTPLQIWVAGGTYKPLYSPEAGANFGTDQVRDNAFLMVNNVQLYGGFAGTETVLTDRDISITTNQAILSGDFNGDDVITGAGSTLSFTNNTENAYHVLISSGDVGTALLNGFTITGGNANDNSYRIINGNSVHYRFGGGMYNSSSLSITNTTFSENNASGDGGGMYNSSSSPVITNTTFSGNNADKGGGGMFNSSSSPTINNTTFSGNNASGNGGGMFNIDSSSPKIYNTTFSGNSATYSGGGMFNNYSSPTITNTTFSGNSADNGGGMYNIYSSSPVITNTTFSGNSADNGGGMYNIYSSSPKIYNSIVWGAVYNDLSFPDIQYSLVQGNTDTSNGNLDATGLTEATIFTDPTNGDYSLLPNSSAINAGNNSAIPAGITTDANGNTRIYDTTVDMGAYESQVIFTYTLPIITQIYHSGTEERWIEITNTSTFDIPANTVNIALYKNTSGDQTGIVPGAEYTINTAIISGASLLIRKNTSAVLSHIGTTVEEANVTDFDDNDDILIITSGSGTTAWANRYDVVTNIADESSYVRNDDVTVYNSTYTTSEWTYFSNDLTGRNANAPMLSDIATAVDTSNPKLGNHQYGSTSYQSATWSNGEPDVTRSVVFEDNLDKNTDLKAREITVNSTYKLTMTDAMLVVADALTIHNGAEIRLAGTAQLIQTHAGSGLVNGTGKLLVDQNSATDDVYRYNYLSSPVNSIGVTTFSIADVLKDGSTATSNNSTPLDITFTSGNDGATGSPITLSEKWIYNYTGNANGYVQKLSSGTLNPTEGFTLKGPGQAQNYTFVGTPKDGDLSFTMGTNDYYLTGNPYPSAISAEKFIEDNESVISGTIYLWEQVGSANGHAASGYIGGYATLNKVMGLSADNVTGNNTDASLGIPYIGAGTYQTPKNYIPVGQGFFVATTTNSGTVTFNNSQREYVTEGASSVFFKTAQANKTASNEKAILKLGIDYENNNGLKLHKQLGMAFDNNYSMNYEAGYDAISFNQSDTEVVFKLPNSDDNYVIAAVPSISQDMEIPLSITTGNNGDLSFTIDEWQNISEDVYLIDNTTETTQLLNNATAKLSLEPATEYTDRFAIGFVSKTLSDDVLQEGNDITITYNDQKNTIEISNYGSLTIENIKLYALSGKLVGESNNSDLLYLGNNKHATGIYIIKIKTNEGIVTKKIIIQY